MNLLHTTSNAVQLKTVGDPEFLHQVSHQRPGPDLVVGHDSQDRRRLLVEIRAGIVADHFASAEAATNEMLNALAAEVDAQVDASAEMAAARQASAAHDAADAELKAARGRLETARSEYERAVGRGVDPRAFRPALNAALQEVEDLEAWVGGLHANYNEAAAAAGKLDTRLWREACAGRLETAAGTRAQLRAKVARSLSKLAAELLTVSAIEKALRGPRLSRPTERAKPAAVPIEELILAEQEQVEQELVAA